ncbi:MAG: hypothetical protein AAFU80_04565 [Pseudomonadota bacterium]
MRRALVHVGLPKAGSTALQRFVAANRVKLAARGLASDPPQIDRWSQLEFGLAACQRAGVLVPDAMLRARLGLSDLTAQAARVAPLEAARPARPGLTLISSEHIAAWLTTPPLRAALDAWLGARFDRVAYLIVLRPQAAFVLSSWSESIRRGSSRPLEAFAAGFDEIDVAATARDWAEQFGPRMHGAMLPDRPGDLERGFCRWLGIDMAGLTVPPPANPALSAPAAELLRRANAMLGPDIARPAWKRAAFAALRAPVSRALAGAAPLALDAAQTSDLAARYPDPIPVPQGRDVLVDLSAVFG